MPPPAPHNLNKWLLAGSLAMVGTGLVASLRNKGRPGGLEFVRVADDAAASAATSAAPSEAGVPDADAQPE